MPVDIDRAEKKLRQANFFLAHLCHAAVEMSLQMRKASQPNTEVLEYWVSACLSAAQSVYYVLEETGGDGFDRVQKAWRHELGKTVGDGFGWIIGLRGKDVHFATMSGNVMLKMVPAPMSEQSWYFGNDALNGPFEFPSHRNPDGSVVNSAVTMGSFGLYIDTPAQERLDAEVLCRRFIEHLRALLARATAELGQ